ncbi:MAG: DUF1801 domain-containing protein [Planctomycetota bacterium]|nr:DUF1801 domain-containing protein [Planctomycetota bacterium]
MAKASGRKVGRRAASARTKKKSTRAAATKVSKKSRRGGRERPTSPDGRRAAPGAPRLLSGGNPQIAKADGEAPVRAYLAAMPGWKRDIGLALDSLIVRTVPGVRKAVRWNTPFYGVEGRGWFVAFHCFDRYVKVTFFRGTSLDPTPPIGSKSPGVRYAHVHEGERADDRQMEDWVRQAAALPGENCF